MIINSKTKTTIYLAAGSLLALTLMLARGFYFSVWSYSFLTWNLFLAWMPVLFGLLAVRWREHWWLGAPATGLWLLFFPNAPYLITDLMHLQWITGAPAWFDALMFFAFVLNGLMLGFVSLSWMQELVSGRWGAVWGWAFALCSMVAGSFGIYIGRFLRWNSWDLFVHPLSFAANLWDALRHPAGSWRMAMITLTLSALLWLAYLIFTPPGKTQTS